jgi:hypothetical protein
LNSFKVRISSTLLPLGYNHLKVPFGGKNLAQTLKTQESDTKTFDPVNSSLLVQDQEGLKLIKKLKKRVDKIQINRSNPEGSQKIKREVHFKHNNKLTDSIRKSMIKPIFIEKVAFKADQALRNIPEFTGIPLDLTNLNTDRIINNFRKRDSIFKKSNEHFLQLFQLSKLPPEVRDKHCQKEIPKEVLNFGGTTKRVSRSTSKVKESLRNLSPSQLKKEKDFQERGEIDPNRLPYLYLCPSI